MDGTVIKSDSHLKQPFNLQVMQLECHNIFLICVYGAPCKSLSARKRLRRQHPAPSSISLSATHSSPLSTPAVSVSHPRARPRRPICIMQRERERNVESRHSITSPFPLLSPTLEQISAHFCVSGCVNSRLSRNLVTGLLRTSVIGECRVQTPKLCSKSRR